MAGRPQADSFLMVGPLALITRVAVRFPWVVLAAAVVLAVVALSFSAKYLGLRTSRLDLLNPKSNYNKLWIDYINEFGDDDDAIVVVESRNPDQVVIALDEIASTLNRESHLFHAVLHEKDLSKVRAKALYHLPPEELQTIRQFLDRLGPVLDDDWSRLSLSSVTWDLVTRLADPSEQAAADVELARFADSLLVALRQDGDYRSPWPETSRLVNLLSQLNSEYLVTNEGRLGFVALRLASEGNAFDQGSEAIDQLRRLLDQIEAVHPETKIGLTGLPVMENDEMRSSKTASIEASLLSLFGVACLFIAGFGGLRHPLMTVASLALALAWSLGYVTLAIGHLNILSMSFGVILIGLGIDFGIHYVARYLHLRATIPQCDIALVETARSVGPGIVTGGLTTALAFFSAGLTEFTGVAELGVIAGGGILLCITAAIFVLPAMIQLADRGPSAGPLPKPLAVSRCISPLEQVPGTVLLFSLVLTMLLSTGLGRVWYDHNLLNLQPVGLESVELERKLLAESDQSLWFALSIADNREELLARKAQFERLTRTVERTEEIASLLPVGVEEKQPVIEHIHRRLDILPERPPLIQIDSPDDLGRALAQAQSLAGEGPNHQQTWRHLEQIRDILRRTPVADCYRLLSDYQQRMAGDLLSRLYALRAMANPEPPQMSDLPESLVTRFVSGGGRHLLKIYSRGDIWDMEALEAFVHDVRSVDAHATGKPLQTFEASRQMQRSYINAALYSLIAITIVLVLDFGNLGNALLAMLPVSLGMLLMFGLLGLLNIPLNPANMIVLPLILGIGIDDGVHVIHDFRSQQGRYRLTGSTATAIVMTSLTTMVGFGSLMIASHRGLQSLGRVLTIGVACCMVTSLLTLPAILVLMSRNRRDETTPDTPDTPDAEPQLQAPRRRATSLPIDTLDAATDPVLPPAPAEPGPD